ncbi:hypothetical protein KIW84_012904 [Lathyrus oleraceus]|uniref:Uncharacterized protein n=1 Tax=Pisum sativum TaxID=3888 RepID=A0A9D5GX01_PEA|nr:hypothetical protein KIW84_012904 [Pisum sativum]
MTKVHDLSISTTYTKPCLKFTTGLCNPIGKGKATASGSQPVEKGNQNTQMMQGQALCFGSGLDPSEPPKPPVSPYISGPGNNVSQVSTSTSISQGSMDLISVLAVAHTASSEWKSSEPPFGSPMPNPASQVSTVEGTSVGNSAAIELDY